jgi:ABC-type multidrug transport system fused ATPase/permease subunit
MKKRCQRWVSLYDNSLRDIKRSVTYFAADRHSIYLLLALTAVSTAVGMLQAWPLAVLIDSLAATAPVNDWIHRWFLAPLPNSPLGHIVGLALIALFLRVIQEALGMWRKMLRSRIDYKGVLRLRCELFRKMQGLHLGYHRAQSIGDGIFRLNTDTFGCMQVLGVLINVVFAVVTLFLILGVQVARSPALTLIALAAVPPLIWANFRFGRALEQRTRAAKKADSAYTRVVHRLLTNIGLTQAYGREDDEFHIFGREGRECVRSWLRIHRQEVAYTMTVGAILGVGGALVLAYGGYLIHERALTPGELMVFMSYLGMLYDPICHLTGANVNLQSGLAGTTRVFEVLDRPTLVMDQPDAVSLPLQPRTLTLRDVTFEYTAGHTVLRGLNATIPPGTSVGFVGSSGVGKSTLLNLLPRFYDPTGGAIILDGHDLRTVKLKDLRRHIAPALQDSIVLPTSIHENISYGRPFASHEDVRNAAALAGAADFIEALPDGYDTVLFEGGQNLSGGQRQRLAIARALLIGAPILVLDEPTSFQDSAHEEILRGTLQRLKGKCTIVLVSHRIATIQDCDMIYVLDGGVICESGTHDELMRQDGVYAMLAGARGSTMSAPWTHLPQAEAHAASSARV